MTSSDQGVPVGATALVVLTGGLLAAAAYAISQAEGEAPTG
jgi:hypothetical protein